MVTSNRKHKDSLFTHYFRDKARLIDAYNAIAGTNYPPTASIEFKAIENVLFKSQYNDVAFLLDDRFIVLAEHQSSINESIPIRMLEYISETYKSILPKKALYQKKLIPLLTPQFYVIYNGLEKYPDKKVLKLSDAFISREGSPNLELSVTVFNIAKGCNKELLRQSTALRDYSVFTSYVYDRMQIGDEPKAAIENAIQYCIKHDIMRVYLEQESSEVRRMLSYEWDEEVYREVLLEQGLEKGLEQGLEQGREESSIEIARKMKADGNPIETIAHYTGLSEDAISIL